MPRLLLLMVLTAAVLGSSGCQSCCHRPVATRTTVVPGSGCPPGGVVLPPPPAPVGGLPPPPAPVGGLPPGAVPPGAVAPGAVPPGAVPPGAVPSISAPPPGPGTVRSAPGNASLSPPRFEPNWAPAEGRDSSPIAKGIPDPLLGPSAAAPGSSAPKLYPPIVDDKSTAEPPLLDIKSKPNASAPGGERKPRSAFPVGIAQFAKAQDGVWSGLQPSIDDGLDWLAANDYRTVLHLRTPTEPESADRKQVEKLGMSYQTITLSPQSLTRAKLEEFAKIVGDVARRPVFVYDQDGSLAGPLWYLYFRKLGDEDGVARIKADSLGLRADREGQHRLMWLAVQQYLEANP